MTSASAKLLVGRRITAYDARRFLRGRGRQVAHDPIIIIDDGAFLSFTVEETDSGEHGVRVNYHPRES